MDEKIIAPCEQHVLAEYDTVVTSARRRVTRKQTFQSGFFYIIFILLVF